MKFIEFSAEGQRLSRTDGGGAPVAGSEGYLVASFSLDEEWKTMKVAASFYDADGSEEAVLLGKGGACEVPAGACAGRRFDVALTGVRPGCKLKTNRVTVYQEAI